MHFVLTLMGEACNVHVKGSGLIPADLSIGMQDSLYMEIIYSLSALLNVLGLKFLPKNRLQQHNLLEVLLITCRQRLP